MENKGLKALFKVNKKIVLVILMKLKSRFRNRLGRSFAINLTEQIVISLFKLKYDLPYRVLEMLFGYDHVTISRAVLRMSKIWSALKFPLQGMSFVVDSTTIAIGKGKNKKTFSGYKHFHGVKFQAVVDNEKRFVCLSEDYDSAIHDKALFLAEYQSIMDKVSGNTMLGDKAYVGLERFNVITPSKRNEKRYKMDKEKAKFINKIVSRERIKVEHCFAKLKSYRVLTKPVYWARKKIAMFVKAIANIINLQVELKN